MLKGKIPVIGVGGVSSAQDAFEFLLAGASAIQVGTAFVKQGTGIFLSLKKDLSELLEKNGFSSVHDAVGKLEAIE